MRRGLREGQAYDELAAAAFALAARLDGAAVHLDEAAGIGIHRGLAQLVRIHFSEPLEAPDLDRAFTQAFVAQHLQSRGRITRKGSGASSAISSSSAGTPCRLRRRAADV